LDAPDIHVFGELLALPSVKALDGTDHAGWLRLLEIFAFEAYPTYKATAGLPELTEAMTLKLRLLTIVALGIVKKRLPYSELIAALGVESLRDLEDIVIEGICRRLFGGKLDQKEQKVQLTFVAGRDLKPGEIDSMIAVMDNWCTHCEELLGDISQKMAAADAGKVADAEAEAKVVEEIAGMTAAVKEKEKAGYGSTGDGSGIGKFDSAEFIDEDSRGSQRANKRHAGARQLSGRTNRA
jgi:COP9 signalosome complex subunit 7